MSLPEVLLVIERSEQRDIARTLIDTHSRHLTTAGVWNERANEGLRRFQKNLIAQSHREPAKAATHEELSHSFERWGVEMRSDT